MDGGFSCTFIKSMNYRSYPVYLISPEMCVLNKYALKPLCVSSAICVEVREFDYRAITVLVESTSATGAVGMTANYGNAIELLSPCR